MTKSPRDRYAIRPDTIFILAIVGIGILVILVSALWLCGIGALCERAPSAVVVAAQDVGRLRSARFIDQFVRRETVIDTEKGSFLVRGAFPALKDHALVLERRQDGNRMLCDPAEKICAPLAW